VAKIIAGVVASCNLFWDVKPLFFSCSFIIRKLEQYAPSSEVKLRLESPEYGDCVTSSYAHGDRRGIVLPTLCTHYLFFRGGFVLQYFFSSYDLRHTNFRQSLKLKALTHYLKNKTEEFLYKSSESA
jgi:hypothetical protein